MGTWVVLGGTALLLVLSLLSGLTGWMLGTCAVWLLLGWQAVRLAVLAPVFPENFGDKADTYVCVLLAYLIGWHFFAQSRFYSVFELGPFLAGAVVYFSCRYGGVSGVKGIGLLRGLWFTAVAGVVILGIQYVAGSWKGGTEVEGKFLPMLGSPAKGAELCALFGLVAALASATFAVRPGQSKALIIHELPYAVAAATAVGFLGFGMWFGLAPEGSRAFTWGLVAGLLTLAWLMAQAIPTTRGNGRVRSVVLWGMMLTAAGGWAMGMMHRGNVLEQADTVWLALDRWSQAPVFGMGHGVWRHASDGGPLLAYAQFLVAYGVVGTLLAIGMVWVVMGALASVFEDARQALLGNGQSKDGMSAEMQEAHIEGLAFSTLALACWATFLGYGITNALNTGPWTMVWLMVITGVALRPVDSSQQQASGLDHQRVMLKWNPTPRWVLRGSAISLGLAAAMMFVSTFATWHSASLWLSALGDMRKLTAGKETQVLTATRLKQMDALMDRARAAVFWDSSSPLPLQLLGDVERHIAVSILTQAGTDGPSAEERAQARQRIEAAADAYRKALALNSSDEAAMVGLAMAYSIGDKPSEATDLFAAALRKQPENGLFWTAIGWHFAREGSAGEALEAMERGEFCDLGRESAMAARLKLLGALRTRGSDGAEEKAAALRSEEKNPNSRGVRSVEPEELIVP